LTRELPPLVGELKRRSLHVSWASYNRMLWDPAPRKVPAAAWRIRLAWFASLDVHVLSLTGTDGDRVELLVVPPEYSRKTAVRAMALAAASGNRSSPTQLLNTAAGGSVPSQTSRA
jgi:hypothetical protein